MATSNGRGRCAVLVAPLSAAFVTAGQGQITVDNSGTLLANVAESQSSFNSGPIGLAPVRTSR